MSVNPLKGEVSFQVGEETMTLVYSIDALCTLEERLDMSVSAIGDALRGDPRMGFMRTVFWGGLRTYQPDLPEKDAGELISVLGGARVMGLIADGFAKAFGGPEAAKGSGNPRKRPAPKRAGTGRASSPSGAS